MASIFKVLLLSSLMILCIMHLFVFKHANAVQKKAADNDDLDSFFEGSNEQEEIEELIPHRAQNTPIDEVEDTKKIEEEPKYYYTPPEPVPQFDSAVEKYVYYFRKYMVEAWIVVFCVLFLVNFIIGKKAN